MFSVAGKFEERDATVEGDFKGHARGCAGFSAWSGSQLCLWSQKKRRETDNGVLCTPEYGKGENTLNKKESHLVTGSVPPKTQVDYSVRDVKGSF